ncbi:FG-GAP-like repeat-containing protein [Methyloterricola oryzae]|uniref:FG-GAP-like repeat-containing protein n=1 Tax=Methyloterricola oryzae TaxID=1495050 RepID=UPI00069BAD4F|nr:FG-GAP-like repeat-containing protein [Methyloterricola oryzae]
MPKQFWLNPLAQAIAIALPAAGLMPADARADLTQTRTSAVLTASVNRTSTVDRNNVLQQGTPSSKLGVMQLPPFSSKLGVLTGVQLQLNDPKLQGSERLQTKWATQLDTNISVVSHTSPQVKLTPPSGLSSLKTGDTNGDGLVLCNVVSQPTCPRTEALIQHFGDPNIGSISDAAGLDPYVGESGTVTAALGIALQDLAITYPSPVGSLASATYSEQATLTGPLAITYSYLNHSDPFLSDKHKSDSLSFGTVLQGDNATRSWSIVNRGAAPNVGLDMTGIAIAGTDPLKFDLGLGTSPLRGLDSGLRSSYVATLDTAQPGSAQASFHLQLSDSEHGAAASRFTHQLNLSLSGTVAVRAPDFLTGEFGTGFQPASPIMADLDRDGKLDLVVLDRAREAIKVFNGRADGLFENRPRSEVGFTTGQNPVAMAVGDVDNDGRPDAVVANFNDDTVSLFHGDGKAGFAPATTLAAGSGPIAVALNDLNRDGKLDLVIADSRSNQVQVSLGTGGGKFAPAQSFAAGASPYGLTVGDIDRDGKPDVAVTNPPTGRVNLLLGKGDGTLKSRKSYPVGSNPLSLVVTDVGGDGFPDLVVSNHGGNLSLLAGVGGRGVFEAATAITLPAGSGPGSIDAADLNKDGHPDLVVSNLGSNSLSVLTNLGQGRFGDPLSFPVGAQPLGIAVADIDADGRDDITVANAGTESVSLLLNTTVVAPSGRFVAAPGSPLRTGTYPWSVAVADFNRDGKPDLAATDETQSAVSVYLGTGGGRFKDAQPFATGPGPWWLATGDFNGDGRMDLATANPFGKNVSVLLGTGDGQFQAAQSFPVGGVLTAIEVNDFNGDGKADLAVTDGGEVNKPGRVAVLLGAGDGTFPSIQGYQIGVQPKSLAAGDLDNDGKPDLAVVNTSSSSVSILKGTGNGQFALPRSLATGTRPSSIALGDVNADGKSDLLVATEAPSLSVWLGSGDGNFQTFQVFSPPDISGTVARYVKLGEFNGDGKPDIALIQYGHSVILTGTGDGHFVPTPLSGTGIEPHYGALGDLDADGRTDLVTSDLGSGIPFAPSSLKVLLNRAP